MSKIQDDVIRVRIDVGRAVSEFLALLTQQAAEGETMAPAKPANRAIFRELAPLRLLEYAYIDPAIGDIDGVYLGFPDGSLYSVSEDIPETVVDALVQESSDFPPIYLYILLAEPRSAMDIDHFLEALGNHLAQPLVGVFRDAAGRMAARSYDRDSPPALRAALANEVTRSVLEANCHYDKARVLRRLAERNLAADGRAFARLSYKFTQHVVEFANSAERDDFIAWSRTMCEWVYARRRSWDDIGLTEILRPAEIAAEPRGEIVAVRLVAPCGYANGSPWQAFGGHDQDSTQHFTQSEAAICDAAMLRSVELAKGYWRYVTETIAAGETLARALADQRRRRGMKLD